ncbi:MAG: hypothetical protein RLZZ417_2024 [Bacteroidota bacterium]|jgi:DUF1680 family protein
MRNIIGLFILGLISTTVFAQKVTRKLENINFSKVTIEDAFWKPRMEKVAEITIPVCMDQTEIKTPRIRNFEITAGMRKGEFEGIFYDDSDVFKALEAIAYSLKVKNNPDIEKRADEWIDKIAAAQQPDGYINTFYTLKEPDKKWSDMSMHEDYNGGHLIEAGVAYFNATGKRKLLDVAIKFADHFDSFFGPNKRHWVTGHQELELALVKLYKTTGNSKYLNLADWLLSERGHKHAVGYTWTDWRDTAYAQDVLPVKQQTQITGHAVRAMYLYTGAADVAAMTGDGEYFKAMKTVWEDVVHRNMYVTGGIGSSGSNEGFSVDYDLPNEKAYCETCASVGMVFWNQRMNALSGNAQYIDVLEKVLYNSALDGLSFEGDRFFYGNPLASNGQHFRKEWFGTACCPSNIARLVASLGDYVYGVSEKDIYVNLFIGSSTSLTIQDTRVDLRQITDYPWNGKVSLEVTPAKKSSFTLRIRIPGWLKGQAVPGDLYQFKEMMPVKLPILLNGVSIPYKEEAGYAVIEREWKMGDKITFELPLEIKRVTARPEVKAAKNRVALQRGPLIYCVEGTDNEGKAWNFVLPDNESIKPNFDEKMLGGIMTLQFNAPTLKISADGLNVSTSKQNITAIPYFSWCNRGQTPMQVWLPTKMEDIKINY